jgi:nucleoside-diphosphate-sugar epimerase
MPATVLVTGGTGFVARWCINELLGRGFAVRATVRDAAKEPSVRRSVPPQHADALAVAAADLTEDAGWETAMEGCSGVLHVASPLGGGPRGDRDALVAPARDGTLRILRAARSAGVRRVVATSAAATARRPLRERTVSDETCWADADDPQFDAYRRSKILAERAAWDHLAATGETSLLTTILPGAVFGPILDRENLGSVRIIERMLAGRMPGTPRIGLSIVDARDLARLHVDAMLAPAAAGERFLATGEHLWMSDIARILREELGSAGSRVPTRELPNLLVRVAAWFDPELGGLTPMLGQRIEVSSEKARRILGFDPRSARETVVDCARSVLA